MTTCNGKGFFDLVMEAYHTPSEVVPKIRDGWSYGLDGLVPGHYADGMREGGEVRRIMRTRGGSIYDVETGARLEDIIAWRARTC